MGTTNAGKIKYDEIKKQYGPGNSYKSDLLFDQWDALYGNGILSYEVYVLTNPLQQMLLKFGNYLNFHHRPFYVGYGSIGQRSEESRRQGRNQCNYDNKTKLLNEIYGQGDHPRSVIIGHFQTKAKAMLAERKTMNAIDISFLTNIERHRCDLKLTRTDCNVIYNKTRPIIPLTMFSQRKRPV